MKTIKQLNKIQLSNHIHISDPCYKKGNQYRYEITNMLAGTYIPYIELQFNHVWSITVLNEDYRLHNAKWTLESSADIGVDSGNCGVFCDSIYPQRETGEYREKGFYNDCCKVAMQNYDEHSDWFRLKHIIAPTNERINDKQIAIYLVEYQIQHYKKELDLYSLPLEEYIVHRSKEIDKLASQNENLEGLDDISDSSDEWYIERWTKEYNNKSIIEYYQRNYDLYNNYLKTGILPEEPEVINYGTVYDKGVVSQSGYGDGSYSLYTMNVDDKVVGVQVVFVCDDEECDDLYDEIIED